MSERDSFVFLKHIRDSIDYIKSFLEGVSRDDFFKDVKLQDAVVRRIEIIGEAVKNLSASFREMYKEIPWKDIAGMRDKITHHYFGVDLETVWKVVNRDLADLERKVKDILSKEKVKA